MNWFTNSSGTVRPGKLLICSLTVIPDGDFFLSSNPSIYSAMALPPLEHSNYVIVKVSIGLASNSKGNVHFNRKTFNYFRVNWNGLPDFLRDVPRENILDLDTFAEAPVFFNGSRMELIYRSLRSSLINPHCFSCSLDSWSLQTCLGRSWLNLCLMSFVVSICFYEIIPYRVWSKFGQERSPINSCNCYTNHKKENNEQNIVAPRWG